MEVASGASETVDMTWDYVITIQSLMIFYKTMNPGDSIDLYAKPDTPVGALTQPAAIGDTVLHVSQAVVDSSRPSHLVKLINGGTENGLGRIVAVDRAALTITTSTATTDIFAAGTTAVVTAITYALGMPVPPFQTHFGVGGDAIEGTDIHPGMVVRIVYHNAGPSPARIVAYAKYLT